MDDLLDERNIIKLIEIYPSFVGHVEVDAILHRSNDGYILVFTHQEVVRLSSQRHVEERKLRDSFVLKVEPNYSILAGKEQVRHFSIVLGNLEFELHGYFLKGWVVLDLNSLDLLKLVHRLLRSIQVLLPFENENLVRLVLIHDKFFT